MTNAMRSKGPASLMRWLAMAVTFACMPSARAGTMTITPELRQAATLACTTDVLRLCPTVLFDEQKIFGCMKANRAQLTPDCAAIFDQGAKTVRR